MNDIYKPEEISWKSLFTLVINKLKSTIKKKEKVEEKAPVVQEPVDDRSHLHDWHNNTLDKLEPIPEVERYKAYIRQEHLQRELRMKEAELQTRRMMEAEKKRKNQKPKRKKKCHKSKYYNDYRRSA